MIPGIWKVICLLLVLSVPVLHGNSKNNHGKKKAKCKLCLTECDSFYNNVANKMKTLSKATETETSDVGRILICNTHFQRLTEKLKCCVFNNIFEFYLQVFNSLSHDFSEELRKSIDDLAEDISRMKSSIKINKCKKKFDVSPRQAGETTLDQCGCRQSLKKRIDIANYQIQNIQTAVEQMQSSGKDIQAKAIYELSVLASFLTPSRKMKMPPSNCHSPS